MFNKASGLGNIGVQTILGKLVYEDYDAVVESLDKEGGR